VQKDCQAHQLSEDYAVTLAVHSRPLQAATDKECCPMSEVNLSITRSPGGSIAHRTVIFVIKNGAADSQDMLNIRTIITGSDVIQVPSVL